MDKQNKIVCVGCEKNSIEPCRELFESPDYKGWRIGVKRMPYCPECRNKGMGGKNAIKINGLWYTEKELKQYIERMP